MSDEPKRELLPGEAEVDAWVDSLREYTDLVQELRSWALIWQLPKGNVVPDAADEIERLREENGALEAAALDFIAKVDRGEARSQKSYAAFKAALKSRPTSEG